jgi:hypothetical protein
MITLLRTKAALFVIASMTLGIFACAQDQKGLDEMKVYYREMIDLGKEYSRKLDQSKSGKEASDVVIRFIENRNRILEKGNELKKKYPDFQQNEALREYESSLEDAMTGLTGSINVAIEKYKSVKEFKDAIKKLRTPADVEEKRE